MEVRHLKPMFDLGQLGLMSFSPRDEQSIIESIKHSDVVINMIGKHYETKHIVPTRRADGTLSRINYDFNEVHSEIPRRLARLAREHNVPTFIHFSSLSANPKSHSRWSQSKARGEAAVREEFPSAIIVKPATVFGAEDRFLNWIGEACERLPFFPLINGGSALVQPVYAVDIGKAVMNIINKRDKFAGRDFELAGPAEYSYKEVVEFVSDVSTVKKPLVDVPFAVANLAAKFVNETISPFLTPDMIEQLQEDVLPTKQGLTLKDFSPEAIKKLTSSSVEGLEDIDLEAIVKREATRPLTFKDLDMEPASMDKAAFDYIHRFRPGGHFTLVQGYH